MIDLNIVRQLIEMAAISPEFRPFAEALTACEAEIMELQGSSDVIFDDFAMQAMNAILATGAIAAGGDTPAKVAKDAYTMARAMMAERGSSAPAAVIGSQEPVSGPTADSVTRELFQKKG